MNWIECVLHMCTCVHGGDIKYFLSQKNALQAVDRLLYVHVWVLLSVLLTPSNKIILGGVGLYNNGFYNSMRDNNFNFTTKCA